jgi:hypothetical protein
MYNPLDTIRRFWSRLGKPIRPIIELQKNASIVNIVTSSVQTENLINDTYRTEAWEVPTEAKASAIYIDGVFKGMGFFATEEGAILTVSKEVDIHGPVTGEDGKPLHDKDGNVRLQKITFAAKGILGRLLDASLYERGSALKPSMMQTIIYCLLVGGFCFMAGMSYGH